MAPRYVKMNIEDAEYFDMFDDVEFKYLKNIVDVEGYEFSILDCCRGEHWIAVTLEIEDTYERISNGREIMRVTFEFDLGMCLTRPFICKRLFDWTSPYGIKLNEILYPDDEEEEDPTSVINVM